MECVAKLPVILSLTTPHPYITTPFALANHVLPLPGHRRPFCHAVECAVPVNRETST